ncbi:MAG TPA: NEW3 domain-containing protein [Pseudonocardiaceae bacterium]|nr:NEW3 domain-containing protein [Pseudonocardiaceae bacterium]
MALQLIAAESTELFIGPQSDPLQVVRVELSGHDGPAHVHVVGSGIRSPRHGPDATIGRFGFEIGVDTSGSTPGTVIPARAVVRANGEQAEADFDLTVAEPGWTMHMISHFHYDPVWWNTQAAYTSEWDALDFPGSPRGARQLAGFDLVRAHLELALSDDAYRFVLAEVDYLKPYWDTHPEDREVLRRLVEQGRVEIMGGAYNEPNTNLTNPETTIRNFVHGTGFQRHVLGAQPQTAWQLDVFGHDPAFPGLAADTGLSASSWARGPFHQWGPMERRDGVKGDPARMQFPSEFEWISPSGRGLLTAYMADHYSAGWGVDSAASLTDAEQAAYELFLGLKKVAATKHVLLPVGTDYTPPNKWITQIHHDWNSHYTWPRFTCSLPKDFFGGVRSELAHRGEQLSPQTRDMNPIYTGKDVSYIDTKQAQREAENALLDAEKFSVFASVLTGTAYPDAALAKAWVQLVYGAHHDGITGSESDQVYLDLVAGWREARELGGTARDNALRALTSTVDTTGDGTAVVVWNPLTRDRSGMVTVRLPEPAPGGVLVLDDAGHEHPCLVEHDGRSVTFRAEDVPSLGWRTFRFTEAQHEDQGWQESGGVQIANGRFLLTVDPERGGGVSSLVDLQAERELIAEGAVGNELAVYEEYPQHPRFGEGPWHLLPKGPRVTSAGSTACEITVWHSAIGERVVVRGEVGPVSYTQRITLWKGVDRVECSTTVDEFTGADQLLRVRWPCPVPGALPVSEVGNAVVGRGFGLIDVDSGRHPWTLDNPAHTWFGLSAAASVDLGGAGRRPIGVAEIVVPEQSDAGPLARSLAVALARSGVTATVSTAAGARYGHLDVDSNLPDVRIALGGPEINSFTADLLDRIDPTGQAWSTVSWLKRIVHWVPAEKPLQEVWVPGADLRDCRALPVLIVAGDDLPGVIASVVDDLADHVIETSNTADGEPPHTDRTVALLNRGMPGFAVDSGGTLHASLLRSCTGWPSGVWINPPRRTVPDGSNFQQQHWTHVFEYAVACGDGDWRTAGISEASAEFSHPLLALVAGGGEGKLPPSGSLLRVEPSGSVSLAACKAAGNPLTRNSAEPADPRSGIALRLAAHAGEPVTALVSSPWIRFTDPALADLLEQRGDPLPSGDELAIQVGAFDAVTVVAKAEAERLAHVADALAPEAEPAQPLFARYWLHNRGPAPLGGLPAAVHLSAEQRHVRPGQERTMRLSVASNRTDGDLHGLVHLALPDGWKADLVELPFGLPPGGHVSTDVVLTAPDHVVSGLYPVRARLELVGDELPCSWRQAVEDVVLLTVPEESDHLLPEIVDWPDEGPAQALWLARTPEPVTLARGERGTLSIAVATPAHAPIAVEAQLISPWGTWDLAGPWSQGGEIPARGRLDLHFDVVVPPWAEPGRWWALVKVVGAGTVHYTPAVCLEVTP